MNTIVNIPAKKARIKLGEMLNQAHYEGFTFVITKQGKPVARLLGVLQNENPGKKAKQQTMRFAEFDLGSTSAGTLNRKVLYANRLSRTLRH